MKETDSQPSCRKLTKYHSQIFEKSHGKSIQVSIGDLNDMEFFNSIFERFRPDVVVHYAEQPSAPYSMKGYEEAKFTLSNNLQVTFNFNLVIRHNPSCHIVKLGTMGEYGTPEN